MHMELSLSSEAPVAQPLKKFPTFYGTWRFITMFTRALHRSLSQAKLIKPVTTYTVSRISILMLSSNLHLSLPSGLLPYGFLTRNPIYMPLCRMHATCFSHLNLPDLIVIIIFGEQYKFWSSSVCSFLQPLSLHLFGPNILSILFSNTLSLCSSHNVRDQVSRPYRTTGKLNSVFFYCLCTMKLSTSPYIKWFTLTWHITTSTGFSWNLALELKQIRTKTVWFRKWN
jgi:hypothetical protein